MAIEPQRCFFVLTILAALCTAPLAAQPVPVGGELQVNTYTTNDQQASRVAVNASGELVVVWESTSQDGSSYGVFGQRYDPAGVALGGEFQVNTFTTGAQGLPRVAMNDDGRFVVVWQSGGQDGSQYGVFGRRYDAAGAALGGEFQVNTYTTGYQWQPDVAIEDDGDFLVVWAGDRFSSGFDVRGRRYDSGGTPVGSIFQVNTYTTNSQSAPAVAIGPGGEFVVAWDSYLQDGSAQALIARRFDSAGTPLGGEFQVNTYTTYSQVGADVAVADDGDFIVAWNSGQIVPPAIFQVFAQRYDSSGAAQGANFQVNTDTTGLQAAPSIGIDYAGRFTITWQDGTVFTNEQDGSRLGVFGQHFDSSGTMLGAQFQVNTTTAYEQRFPTMAMNRAGEFVVSWSDDDPYGFGTGHGADGDRSGVFAQRLLSPCSDTQALTQDQWRMISLPCDPGAADAVADVFGDDMTGTYGVDWIVFERDEAAGINKALGLASPLAVGRGYWIKTLDSGETVTVGAGGNHQADVPLTAGAGGVQNLLGHPFPFEVCWADVRVIDGASVLTLDEADPGGICQTMTPGPTCVMSRLMYQWTGAAYAPFDGQTPGAEGSLTTLEGFWAKAFKPGISLRVPLLPAAGCSGGGGGGLMALPEKRALNEYRRQWYVRLIAESDELRDDGNVFGHAGGSELGYDVRDLAELPPFGDPYLTVVFPHGDWGERAADYATDFHPPARLDSWSFEVLAAPGVDEVTLSWEGPGWVFRRTRLVDEETGEAIRPRPDGRYTFAISGSRILTWHFDNRRAGKKWAGSTPARTQQRRGNVTRPSME